MKRRQALAGMVATALAGAGPATARAAAARAIAWPAGLRRVDGGALDAVPGRGRAAIVVFWATWCGYCQRHNARLEQLHRTLGATAPAVVGVAVDGGEAEVARHVRQRGWTFPVVLDPGGLRAQFTSRRVVPVTALVDGSGLLRQLIPGEMAEDDVMRLPRALAA